MRRATVLLLAVGLVALAATASDARGHGMGRGPRGCGMGPCTGMGPLWADSSAVSAEVRERITQEQAAFQAETLDLRTQLFNKTERFELLMADANAKDDDILKLHQEIHSLRGQLAQKHVQHILKIRKELPEGMRAGRFMMGAGCGMGPCGGSPMGPGPMKREGMGQGMGAGCRGFGGRMK